MHCPRPTVLHKGSNFSTDSSSKENTPHSGSDSPLFPSTLPFDFLISDIHALHCRILSCSVMRRQRISQAESCQWGHMTHVLEGSHEGRGCWFWAVESNSLQYPLQEEAGRGPVREHPNTALFTDISLASLFSLSLCSLRGSRAAASPGSQAVPMFQLSSS